MVDFGRRCIETAQSIYDLYHISVRENDANVPTLTARPTPRLATDTPLSQWIHDQSVLVLNAGLARMKHRSTPKANASWLVQLRLPMEYFEEGPSQSRLF